MTSRPAAREPAVFFSIVTGFATGQCVRQGRPHPPGSVEELELYPTRRISLGAAGRWVHLGRRDESAGCGQRVQAQKLSTKSTGSCVDGFTWSSVSLFALRRSPTVAGAGSLLLACSCGRPRT